MKMAKKTKEETVDLYDPARRCCPTCVEWAGSDDPIEYPCSRVKGMVYRKSPRADCGSPCWNSQFSARTSSWPPPCVRSSTRHSVSA